MAKVIKDAVEKTGVEQQAVPIEIFNKLQDQLREVNAELETYRQRSPIVGVRWYGGGGFGIGLSHPVNGIGRIALNGYGDKAVIDYATWVRIKNTEHARFGLLVRDDDVIDEMHITGVKAKADVDKGPNSFNDKEVKELLKIPQTKLQHALNDMDSHWGPIHLLKAAAELGITGVAKIAAIKRRRDELSCEFRWSLLHPHDLKLACEQYKIPGWENMIEDEMVKVLAKIELEQNNEFE